MYLPHSSGDDVSYRLAFLGFPHCPSSFLKLIVVEQLSSKKQLHTAEGPGNLIFSLIFGVCLGVFPTHQENRIAFTGGNQN